MSGNNNNIHSYLSSDIEKYLNGDLSASEMHALEKAALDDPFLADALEGIELHRQLPDQPPFQHDLAVLQDRLEQKIRPEPSRIQTRKNILPVAWRVAAAAAILVGLGITAWLLDTRQNKVSYNMAPATIAKTETHQSAPMDTAPSRSDSIGIASAQANTSPVVAAPGSAYKSNTSPFLARKKEAVRNELARNEDRDTYKHNDALLPSPKSSARINRTYKTFPFDSSNSSTSYLTSPAPKPTIIQSAPPAFSKDTLSFPPISGLAMEKNRARLTSPSPATYNDFKQSAFARVTPPDQVVFSGKVTDLNNNALPGAALTIKGQNAFSTMTDRNGYYSFKLPRTDTVNKLVVASVGYQEADLLLSQENRTGNLIQLRSQPSSLNEVVVMGYGAKRKETLRKNIDAPSKSLSTKALPADGWPLYEQYIELNKKTPGLDSTLIGNETISFIVNSKGSISSFKIEQSISPAHDSAAIQLIRRGPSWKLMKGRNARAVVIISYP